MDTPELSRTYQRGDLNLARATGAISANSEECAALAKRFGLASIDNLEAQYALSPVEDGVRATGDVKAALQQYCAISGQPFPVKVAEKFDIIFFDAPDIAAKPDEEIELSDDDCDMVPMDGDRFDLGEAVAQSLFLALDPYAEGPDADARRREYGLKTEDQAGPFGALADLKAKLEGKS